MPVSSSDIQVVQKAERFGSDFALSMIKLHRFGGPSQFWDFNLESFTLVPAWRPPCRPGFLLPVRALSRLFRWLFLTALGDAYAAGRLSA